MTFEQLKTILSTLQMPVVYHHFREKTAPPPPYIVYYVLNSDDEYADNINFGRITAVNIELYTNEKEFSLEEQLEETLIDNSLTFEKSEAYIDTEHMYQVLYETEVC